MKAFCRAVLIPGEIFHMITFDLPYSSDFFSPLNQFINASLTFSGLNAYNLIRSNIINFNAKIIRL